MTAARAADGARLAGPLGVSAAGHALVFAAFIVFRGAPPPARPPMYHVNLVAAPAGARREGIVTPTPPPQPLAPTQPPPRAKIEAPAMPLPAKTPPRAAPPAATPTPVPAKAAAAATVAQAGGGPTGDRGTDVATVRTEGNDFPYPAYLENIVRQVAKNFGDHRNSTASAEVQFLIRRDGTVTSFRFLTRSGNYSFDLDAQGAVEAAGNARAFGPLPDGFADDVLSVTFSFDPKVVH